jgi:hypothetical protein
LQIIFAGVLGFFTTLSHRELHEILFNQSGNQLLPRLCNSPVIKRFSACILFLGKRPLSAMNGKRRSRDEQTRFD